MLNLTKAQSKKARQSFKELAASTDINKIKSITAKAHEAEKKFASALNEQEKREKEMLVNLAMMEKCSVKSIKKHQEEEKNDRRKAIELQEEILKHHQESSKTENNSFNNDYNKYNVGYLEYFTRY